MSGDKDKVLWLRLGFNFPLIIVHSCVCVCVKTSQIISNNLADHQKYFRSP